MIPFDTLAAAKSGLTMFLMTKGATLADPLREHLAAALASPSPVDMLVQSMEALYAARAELGAEGKTVIGSLAGFIMANGWHGINADDRGYRIVRAMRRDLGEAAPDGVTWPDPSTDPAADTRFAVANAAQAAGLHEVQAATA